MEYYHKENDGWMWWDEGNQQEDGFADSTSLATEKVYAPSAVVGAKGAGVSGASVMPLSSLGNRSVGTSLGTQPVIQAVVATGKQHEAEPVTATVPVGTTDEVQAAAVTSVTEQTTTVATGKAAETVAEAPAVTPVATEPTSELETQAREALRAALSALLKSIQAQGGQVAEFVQATLAKLSDLDVAAILQGTAEGLAKLAQALTETYQAMFGDTYQRSLLGGILDQVNKAFKLEPVRLMLLGGEVPADVKLAAEKEQEFQDAQSVVRDEKGQVLQVVDAKGDRHDYVYDESGVTETITDRAGRTRTLHLDPAGTLLSESSAGRSVTYQYLLDEQGKVKQTTAEERTEKGLAIMLYDQQGQLVSLEAAGKKQKFAYSGTGKEQELEISTTDAQGRMLEQKHYQNGRLAWRKDQDGSTTQYDYLSDGSGKVLAMTLTVTDTDQERTILKYNAAGRLVSALGKDAQRFQKMDQEGTIAEQVFGFDLEKQLFGDPRMDGMRLDNKLQLQQLQGK